MKFCPSKRVGNFFSTSADLRSEQCTWSLNTLQADLKQTHVIFLKAKQIGKSD